MSEEKVETRKTSESQNKPVCRRCGRKLKSLESQQYGMGEVCRHKWDKEHQHKKLFSTLQRPKDNV